MRHHVFDPIGLNGTFDYDSDYPPVAARGFVGTLEDLMLIGCTLSSGGVSPRDTDAGNITEERGPDVEGFHSSEQGYGLISRGQNRQFNEEIRGSRESLSVGVVDGYGLGLWRVRGWRRRLLDGTPSVRGWLAMGSSEALLYFDTKGLVFAMAAPHRVMGLELTSPFANAVRNLGYLHEYVMEEKG